MYNIIESRKSLPKNETESTAGADVLGGGTKAIRHGVAIKFTLVQKVENDRPCDRC